MGCAYYKRRIIKAPNSANGLIADLAIIKGIIMEKAFVHTHENERGNVFATEFSNHAEPRNLGAWETTCYGIQQYRQKFPHCPYVDSANQMQGTVIIFPLEK